MGMRPLRPRARSNLDWARSQHAARSLGTGASELNRQRGRQPVGGRNSTGL